MPILSSFISYRPRKSKPVPPRHPYASPPRAPVLDINGDDQQQQPNVYHNATASTSTPRVQLSMPLEPDQDWFPSALLKKEEQQDNDVLDGLQASDFVNDIHFDPPQPPFIKKPAPSPIKIPHSSSSSTTKVQLVSRPTSTSSPESSAISGTTLARALIANTFVLSAESHQLRSSLTRSDSATLPRSEFGVHSPHWRDTTSTEGSFDVEIPPVPSNAEKVYVPPKTQRESTGDADADEVHVQPQPQSQSQMEETPSVTATAVISPPPISPPMSDPPSSAKDLDNVLDYYSFADSPEPTTNGNTNEQRSFHPTVSPIKEETSSQLSPPTPYVAGVRASLIGAGAKSPDSVKSSMSTAKRGLPPGRIFFGSTPSASAGGARVDWTIRPSSSSFPAASSSTPRRESSSTPSPNPRTLLPIGNRSRSASTTSVVSASPTPPPRPSTSSTSTSGTNTPEITSAPSNPPPAPSPPSPIPLPIIYSPSTSNTSNNTRTHTQSIASIPESVTNSLLSFVLHHPPSTPPPPPTEQTKTRVRVPSPIRVVRGRYGWECEGGGEGEETGEDAGEGAGRSTGDREREREREDERQRERERERETETERGRDRTRPHARDHLQQTFPETPTAFSPALSPPSSAVPPPSASTVSSSITTRSSSLMEEYFNMVAPGTPQFPFLRERERESEVLLARAATSIQAQRSRVWSVGPGGGVGGGAGHTRQGSLGLGRAVTVGAGVAGGGGGGAGVRSLERVGEREGVQEKKEREEGDVKVEVEVETENENENETDKDKEPTEPDTDLLVPTSALRPPSFLDDTPPSSGSIPSSFSSSSRPPSRSSLPQPGPPPQTPLPSTPVHLPVALGLPLGSYTPNANMSTYTYTPPAPVLSTLSLPRLTPEFEREVEREPRGVGATEAVVDSTSPSASKKENEGDESKNTKKSVRVPPAPTQPPPTPQQQQQPIIFIPAPPRIPPPPPPPPPPLEAPSTPHSAHPSPIQHRPDLIGTPVSSVPSPLAMVGTTLTLTPSSSTSGSLSLSTSTSLSASPARRPGMINPPPPHLHLPAPPSASSLYSLSYDAMSPPPYAAVVGSDRDRDRSAGDVVITPSTGGSYDSAYRFVQPQPQTPPVNANAAELVGAGHGIGHGHVDRVQQQTGHGTVHAPAHGQVHRHGHGHGHGDRHVHRHGHGPQTNSVILGPGPVKRRTRPPFPAGPRRPSQPSQQRERNGSVSSVSSQHQPQLQPQPSRPPRQASAPLLTPQFVTPAPKWRGYTLEMAKWTFTSEQLQGIVSRAIRQSAEPSGIRLLQLETVETEIPEEMERLETLRTDTMVKYKVLAKRRANLLEMMLGGVGAHEPDVAFRHLEELKELCGNLDKATEDLHSLDEQLAQLGQLAQAHSSSALAMALRKLNASFLKQVEQVRDLKEQVEALQTERDDAWNHAAEVATEYDEFKSGKIESPDAENRFERVMAVRKSSTRAARAGLRSASIRSNHRDRASIGSSVRGLSGAPASNRTTYVDDRPPVPPIPRRRPIDINTNIPVRSSAVTGVSTEFSTPNSDMRALQRAQDELYDMLGIPSTERSRRSRSAIGPPRDSESQQQAISPSFPDFDAPPNTGRRASLPPSAPLPPDPYSLTANASIMWASDRAGWI